MAEYVCKNGILRPINHIYQCCDRLVEGVDYEVYQWLSGDGAAISIVYNMYRESIECVFKTLTEAQSSQLYLSNMKLSTGYRVLVAIMKGNLGELYDRYNRRTDTGAFISGSQSWSIAKGSWGNKEYYYKCSRTSDSTYTNIVNGVSTALVQPSEGYLTQQTIDADLTLDITAKGMPLQYLKTNRYDLRPIQLLRPISAALSSDNKPHPSGECGMYDSVSGKFYGNANTSGSFSVYND